jgi:hypothetical protein
MDSLHRAYSCNIRIPVSRALQAQELSRPTLVVNDRGIAELKAPCLIRPQPGIAREEDIVMQLLRLLFETPFLRL